MKRENIIALLLVISLSANVYLVFFDHSLLTQHFPEAGDNPLLTFLGAENSSGGPYIMVDEYGQVIPVPPTAVVQSTPSTDPGEDEPPDLSVREIDESPGNGDPGLTNLSDLSGNEDVTEPGEPEEIILDPLVTYTNTKHGFSLVYPRTWTANEAPAGRTVLTLTAPEETSCDTRTNQCYVYIAQLTVEIDTSPNTLVIEDYFNKAVAQLQKQHGITTTSKTSATVLADSRAYQIEYFTRDSRGNPDRSFMQYYTIIDGKGFIISYFGPYSTWDGIYRNNKADAQEIINSFTVERIFKPV